MDDTHGPRWTPDVQGFPVLGSLTPAEKDRSDRAVQSCAVVVDKDSEMDPLCRSEGGGSHRAHLGRLIKAPRWRMRPAGNGGSARRMTPAGRNDARKKSAVRPISAEAVEFSPAPEWNERVGWKTKSSRTAGISPTAVVEPPYQQQGGGWLMPTEGEDVMKISAVRPLSVEAVEFSPASATEQHIRSGRKTMSSGTSGSSGSSPTEVVEPPYQQRGGGGEIYGDSGGSQAALDGQRGKALSPSQWAVCC